jgi:hypothetical protein
MTLLASASSAALAVLVGGLATAALRTRFGVARDQTLTLRFDTAATRARHGWSRFWQQDPFVRAHVSRTGPAFATYAVPGSAPIAVHLTAEDFRHHTLVLGSTGTGKSSLLEAIAREHLRAARPFALIDLHGDLFTRVAAWALVAKPQRLVLLDFTKPDLIPGWNPLTRIEGMDIGRQVDLLVGVLKRLYADEDAASWAWGVKVHEITRHALRACIESKSPMSPVDLPSFLLVPAVRDGVLATASKASRAYFETRYAKDQQYASAVVNKLEPFLGSVAVQRFLGTPTSHVDLFAAIERGDTVLVNLAKGYLGPTADVMGRLLMNALQMATLRREALAPAKRSPYALILDEAHVLAGEDSGLEDFLVAARKYGVFVTLAAQGASLFRAKTRPHLFGNTNRQFFFRLPFSEARALAPDILEPLGSVFREQLRPNDAIEDPLLTPAEEIAWRTRELASLPVGACYWYTKDRPYKARRIQILPPIDLPLRSAELQRRMNDTMSAQKGITIEHRVEAHLASAFERAIEERSSRRQAALRAQEQDTHAADGR